MKKFMSWYFILFGLTIVIGIIPVFGAQFNDTSNHWANQTISQMADSGVINGYPDGSFQPDRAITRAEFVTLLLNLVNPSGNYGISSSGQHWAQPQIDHAIDQGILIPTDYPYGIQPDGNIQRDEAAALIARSLNLAPDYSVTSFTDRADVASSPFSGYIKTVYDNQLMTGYPTGDFKPYDNITRAQATVILSNMSEQQPYTYNYTTQTSSNSVNLGNTNSYGNNSYNYGSSNNQHISKASHDGYTYSADTLIVYDDSGRTSYFLSEAQVADEYHIFLGNESYDLREDYVSVKLRENYHRIVRIATSFDGEPNPVFGGGSPYPHGMSMSDIYAVYADNGQEINVDDIKDLIFRIKNKEYRLNQISFDSSGYIVIDGNRYAPTQTTLAVLDYGNRYTYYDLQEIRSRGSQYILDCSNGASWYGNIIINGRYYQSDDVKLILKADGVLVLKDEEFTMDRVTVGAENLIRIDRNSGVSTGIPYELGRYSFDISYSNRCESIYNIRPSNSYDSYLSAILISTNRTYVESYSFRFYDDVNGGVLNWDPSQVEILVNGNWIRLTNNGIMVTSEDRFKYRDTAYYFTSCRIRQVGSGTQYNISRTMEDTSTATITLYLETI